MKKRKLRKKRIFYLFYIIVFIIAVSFPVIIFLVLSRESPLISPIATTIKNNFARGGMLEDYKKSLAKSNIEFDNISLSSDLSIHLFLKNNGEVIFSSEKDMDAQISSLQLIISRSTIEGKRLSRLDFRFDKPIVVYGD